MTTVLVSGGFDPLHIGHLRYFKAAQGVANIIVVVLNSDDWLRRKKGYVFMPWEERNEVLGAIFVPGAIYSVDDDDGTVCEALRRLKPHYFANGHDRTGANPAEQAVCEELGIEQLFNVGGDKIASSSELVADVAFMLDKLGENLP